MSWLHLLLVYSMTKNAKMRFKAVVDIGTLLEKGSSYSSIMKENKQGFISKV